jgi:HlyD family secretion protein
MKNGIFYLVVLGLIVVSAVIWGVWPQPKGGPLGYIEADWVYVAPAVGGKLETLAVKRGDTVEKGAPLFDLEPAPYRAELERDRAEFDKARASAELARLNRNRQEELFEKSVVSRESLDTMRTRNEEADRAVDAAKAEVDSARWNLEQTQVAAPCAGLVYDTLYSEGEQIAAQAPVVVVLPPEAVYAKIFVGEASLGTLRVGQTVEVKVDGRTDTLVGKIRYIAPKAEYTPPVIYSRENREKFVWKVEIEFTPEVAATLHPGQPVEAKISEK